MRRNFLLVFCVIAITLLVACSSNSDSTTKSEIEVGSKAPPARQNSETITPSNRPSQQSNASQPVQVILHVENNKKIPLTVTQDDFYEAQDAVFMNDEYEKALALIRRGKLFMIENDSSITVLEPSGYLTKIKVKKTGRVGWVKSDWIQPELAGPALNQELLRASRDGQIEAVKSLLERGADINVQDDKWGWTPLMRAADGSHAKVVKLLIARGANLNIKDKSGSTVLEGMSDGVNEQQQAIIRILKRAGAK
jgi:uncharacterized protein